MEFSSTNASVHEASESDFVHGDALFLHFRIEFKWDCAVLEVTIASEHNTISNSPRLDVTLLHLLEQLICLCRQLHPQTSINHAIENHIINLIAIRLLV